MDHHLVARSGWQQPQWLWPQDRATDTGKIELGAARPAGQLRSAADRQVPAPVPGFDDKIVSMYARGMSTREITGQLRELYGIDVSPDLISAVTDAVLEEVAAWQARPLDQAYPLVFFDAIRVKIRDEGMVRNKGNCRSSGRGRSNAGCSPTIRPSFWRDLDPIGVGTDLFRAADGASGDGVAIVVEAHEAGLRHRDRHRMEAVEAAAIGHEARPLRLEHLPHRPITLFGMAVRLGIGDRAVEQPGVQFLVALHPQARREEALAHEADLVLNLALLPTRRRRAGDGIDEVITTHLEKASVGCVIRVIVSTDFRRS